jgi:hypothetical protein
MKIRENAYDMPASGVTVGPYGLPDQIFFVKLFGYTFRNDDIVRGIGAKGFVEIPPFYWF